MSERRGPRNGLAKLLNEADPDDPVGEITAQKEQFECPNCGWVAELCRNECFVCEYNQNLRPSSGGAGGADERRA